VAAVINRHSNLLVPWRRVSSADRPASSGALLSTFYLDSGFRVAQCLELPTTIFVTGFQPLGDLNVSHAGNTGPRRAGTRLFPLTTNTPCTSSFLGSPGAEAAALQRYIGAALFLLRLGPLLPNPCASAPPGLEWESPRRFPFSCLVLAVVDRPGRRFSGGFASVTNNFEVFCFLRARRGCRSGESTETLAIKVGNWRAAPSLVLRRNWLFRREPGEQGRRVTVQTASGKPREPGIPW